MKRFLVGMMSFLLLAACNNPKPEETAETTPAATDSKPQPAEFADPKYTEIGKSGLASMSSGDVDGWSSNWADNIVWQWNNGDSVVGKAAVVKYWKDRRGSMIDSISFSNYIWLPLKVNQPQSTEQAGIWLLSWYAVNAKYKTGKRMMQWIHTAQHFDANDKIDRVVQYLDRVPINAAMAK
ncbi:nuclear transport factor 2 family protein [Lacibacter sediminis]|uniref:Nuclear transport factor 2 family protein n=1 Tax=Lacibacter sediminis TaxID=2760713 RepID=A0A7G5XBR0_9BACT|nr:nuclear transport factor 2 family protein [Lacibacter sediminis]QNA42913.1 nuclear transport factor 2 family protein [Lacibacter sediminis]